MRKQQHQDDDRGRGELRELAARACAFAHRGLRRAAVDHERAGERGGGVRHRQPEDVGVLVDAFVMTRRHRARGRRALRDDDEEARSRHRNQRDHLVPAGRRHGERGEPARDGADDRDAAPAEVEGGAVGDRRADREERDRKARQEAPCGENGADHQNGKDERRRVNGAGMAEDLDQPRHRAARRRLHADEVAQHGNADLDADAGEKSDEDGARQEVREEAELQHARDEKERAREQCHDADERHVFLARLRRHRREAAREDRRGGGVGGDDQVPRRPEQREGDRRQQQRVETRDHRHSGDPRIAHHLRDVHRRQRQPRQCVAPRLAAMQRTQPLEKSHGQRLLPGPVAAPIVRDSRSLCERLLGLGLFILCPHVRCTAERARREAKNEAGPAARRGFATKRLALSAATRRERVPWGATLRCFPREDTRSWLPHLATSAP